MFDSTLRTNAATVRTPTATRALRALLVVAAAAASVLPLAACAAFPDHPLRLVIPFPPGGGTDLVGRQLGQGLSGDLGQSVIVENRGGGSTIIGTEAVAKSPADGYTLLLATFAHAVNPSLHSDLPYSTDKAFAPVALIGRSPNVLVVSPKRDFKSVADVLAYARANPGKLNFGSYGNGTSAHLAGELFKNLAKVNMTHVPYRGSGPALIGLMGGQIDLMFSTIASVGGHMKSGQIRGLAVTSSHRAPSLPQLPTVAESGVPGYVVESWYGVYVATGTPPAVIARLNGALKAAVQTPGFRRSVEDEGLIIDVGTPDELGRYVKAEESRWTRIVKEGHITGE
jgi:tripartite-type tricarboxylate transporter receptor subunit TctC